MAPDTGGFVFSEPIEIEVPDQPFLCSLVPVCLDDDDRAVALRVAPIFPPGTKLRVGDSRWVVGGSEPPAVSRVAEASTRMPSEPPAPGQAFRGRSQQRSGFRIKAIEGDVALTDDGRTIAFDELDRTYRQLAQS